MEALPGRSRLRSMLQTAVQSVDWTYSIFWQRCPQQGILVWGDGYYNGAINTRKTAEPTEVTMEEAALQRSQQLRELYESLIAAESRRPSAALLLEELTEAEWFYLLSVSFSFRPGTGLPGKAYEKQKHAWLAGADEVDRKICPRLIIAKSAGIQTCVCIPVLDGVVELGSIKWVEEDTGLIQDIKSIFGNHSKPAISDYSTSIPSTSFQPLLLHPTVLSHDSAPPLDGGLVAQGDDESESDIGGLPMPDCEAAEANYDHDHHDQLVEQLDMHVGIGVGLLDYESDNLDPYLNVSEGRASELKEVQRWHTLQDPMDSSLHPPDIRAGISFPHEMAQEDTVYSRTVSTILQSTRWSGSSSAAISSAGTAFSKYSTSTSHHHPRRRLCGSPQWALKYILFTVPFLPNPTSSDSSDRLRRDSASAKQEELGGSHVLAERRRREKLNERFVTLRSLVPFVTKMDKASVLGDTIEYLKHQCEKIQELEERTRQMEAKAKQKKLNDLMEKGVCPVLSLRNKKKRRITGDGGEMKNATAQVEVSIIESDALVEIQCLLKEELLINVIQMLRKFMIEVITVQSSMENGVFSAQLRAKVGEGINGSKASIMEVKRAINRIIYSQSAKFFLKK